MKRFRKILIIGLMFLGVGISLTYAQGIPANDTVGNTVFDSGGQTHVVTPQESQHIRDTEAKRLANVSCGWTDWECWPLLFLANIGRLIVAGLGYVLTNLANLFFNWSINVSVRSFNDYANAPGVLAAWRLCRDLVNVAFIFVLLYVAIGTILQLDSVNGKKILSRVIIAAFLVNFSFFLTGIMIDASNVVANEFYNKAAQGHGTLLGAPDIVTPLVQAGTPNLIDNSWNAVANSGGAGGWFNRLGSIIGSYLGQAILMLVTATVLLAGGIMFFARTVILIFVLVSSPLAFLAMAVGGKQLEKLSGKWTSALANQLIFAPVYLLLIFMTIQIITLGGANGQGLRGLVDAGTGGGFLSALVVFTIINGLMLGSLMVAKELGVAGAAGATKFAGGLTGYGAKVLGRTTTGTFGGVGRNLYGGMRQAVLGKDQEGKKASRWSGLGAILTSPKGISVTAGAKSGMEAVRSGRGMLRTVREAVKKPGQAINEAVSAATGINILGRTKEDERKLKDLEKKEREEEQAQNLDRDKTRLKELGKKKENGTITTDEEDQAKILIQKMSTKDLVKIDPDTLVKLAHLLSSAQMEVLKKNDEFKPENFQKIKAAREKPLQDAITEAKTDKTKYPAVQTQINSLDDKALANFVASLDKNATDFSERLRVIAENLDKGDIPTLSKIGGIDRARLTQMTDFRLAAGLVI